MKLRQAIFLSSALASLPLLLTTCSTSEESSTGHLAIAFNHMVRSEPLELNKQFYVNAAGNQYEVTEFQWFLSRVELLRGNGATVPLSEKDWHYIDTNIPQSLTWNIPEELPAGAYTGLRFVFGFQGPDNTPGRFADPPESNMVWPYALGGDYGGYHYMKLNGFWINGEGHRTPFNFHLGVGQEYDESAGAMVYIQNWFQVDVPCVFTISGAETARLQLAMDVASWFETPHIYDHNTWGGMIMQNQEAQRIIGENGIDVFHLNAEMP